MFLIVFWSPKQSKIEESSMESMAKQLEAHLHEEPKLWSFISPFPKANHECKEGKQREKSNMKNSRGQKLFNTFGAFPRVQFMHTICRFEAREVSNPKLQMVHESKLKWRSYSHWKPITPSWMPISQLRNQPLAAKWRPSACKILQPSCMPTKSSWVLPDICYRHF